MNFKDQKIAQLLRLYGYSNVRNIGLVIAQILESDVLVFLDDDVVVSDSRYFHKAQEYVGGEVGGKLLGGVAGYYINDDGNYYLNVDLTAWWKSCWPKERKMNEAFKVIELCSSHTLAGEAGFGMQMQAMFMNTEVWNKLPADIHKIFMDLQSWAQNEIIKMDIAEAAKGEAQARKLGHKMIELTPDEIQLWTKATAPARDKWIADMEAKGLPGKAVYEEAKSLIAKYNK